MMPITSPATHSPLAADAIAGITDPTLAALVGDHWEYLMRWSPTWATTIGDHRYDAVLAPRDQAAITRANAERDAMLVRATAIDAKALVGRDRETLGILRVRLQASRGADVCHYDQWLVDSGNSSVFGELSYLVESHTVTTPADAANLIARLRQGERAIDDTIANLSIGLAAGRVTSAGKLKRAIEQLDTELAKPVEQWSMVAPAWAIAPAAGDPWPAGERDRQLAALHEVVASQLRLAFVRERDFFRDRVMPRARTEREGLAGIADGAACYRAAIFAHIGVAKSPAELHQLGLDEIARTDRELAALGATVLGRTISRRRSPSCATIARSTSRRARRSSPPRARRSRARRPPSHASSRCCRS